GYMTGKFELSGHPHGVGLIVRTPDRFAMGLAIEVLEHLDVDVLNPIKVLQHFDCQTHRETIWCSNDQSDPMRVPGQFELTCHISRYYSVTTASKFLMLRDALLLLHHGRVLGDGGGLCRDGWGAHGPADVAAFPPVEQVLVEPAGQPLPGRAVSQRRVSSDCPGMVLPRVLNGYTVPATRDFLRRFSANLEFEHAAIAWALS
ncbi:MAG: hypothetical protein AAGE43_14370, partial [Pseudomonadota bacterium]